MTHDNLDSRFAFADSLVREAGELALEYFQRFESLTVRSKGLQDMASEADLNVETLIRERLSAAFPEDAFLGEETGHTEFSAEQGIWVVDPIDGTQPFVSGLSSWCVSIAFVKGGRNRLGFVNAPARGELFSGGLGRPALLNGRQIQVKDARSVKDGLVAAGYSTRLPPEAFLPAFERLLKAGGMFYRDGSGALSLAYLAAGRLIGYVERQINSWDCLGALAVIEAAGGQSSDFLAGEGLWKGNPLVVAPPGLYAELEALSSDA